MIKKLFKKFKKSDYSDKIPEEYIIGKKEESEMEGLFYFFRPSFLDFKRIDEHIQFFTTTGFMVRSFPKGSHWFYNLKEESIDTLIDIIDEDLSEWDNYFKKWLDKHRKSYGCISFRITEKPFATDDLCVMNYLWSKTAWQYEMIIIPDKYNIVHDHMCLIIQKRNDPTLCYMLYRSI